MLCRKPEGDIPLHEWQSRPPLPVSCQARSSDFVPAVFQPVKLPQAAVCELLILFFVWILGRVMQKTDHLLSGSQFIHYTFLDNEETNQQQLLKTPILRGFLPTLTVIICSWSYKETCLLLNQSSPGNTIASVKCAAPDGELSILNDHLALILRLGPRLSWGCNWTSFISHL